MELELCLAPPTHSPMIEFDVNMNNVFEPKDIAKNVFSLEFKHSEKNKRSCDKAFEHGDVVTNETLPLLLWNGQPNEDDDRSGQKRRISNTNIKNCEQENILVGWPPINSWRRKLLHGHHTDGIANHQMTERGSGRANSMYVKVKMEGVAIGRKIDLRLYHSYLSLTNSIINMFIQDPKSDKGVAHYTLLYQDKEGDWLLAGDLPWQTFMESVRRMEMLRKAG